MKKEETELTCDEIYRRTRVNLRRVKQMKKEETELTCDEINRRNRVNLR